MAYGIPNGKNQAMLRPNSRLTTQTGIIDQKDHWKMKTL